MRFSCSACRLKLEHLHLHKFNSIPQNLYKYTITQKSRTKFFIINFLSFNFFSYPLLPESSNHTHIPWHSVAICRLLYLFSNMDATYCSIQNSHAVLHLLKKSTVTNKQTKSDKPKHIMTELLFAFSKPSWHNLHCHSKSSLWVTFFEAFQYCQMLKQKLLQ